MIISRGEYSFIGEEYLLAYMRMKVIQSLGIFAGLFLQNYGISCGSSNQNMDDQIFLAKLPSNGKYYLPHPRDSGYYLVSGSPWIPQHKWFHLTSVIPVSPNRFCSSEQFNNHSTSESFKFYSGNNNVVVCFLHHLRMRTLDNKSCRHPLTHC